MTRFGRRLKPEPECLSDANVILKALMVMAVYRQAEATETYLDAFSTRLSREYLPGVLSSLEKLGELPRAEGETAMPSLGTILQNCPPRVNDFEDDDQ